MNDAYKDPQAPIVSTGDVVMLVFRWAEAGIGKDILADHSIVNHAYGIWKKLSN